MFVSKAAKSSLKEDQITQNGTKRYIIANGSFLRLYNVISCRKNFSLSFVTHR